MSCYLTAPHRLLNQLGRPIITFHEAFMNEPAVEKSVFYFTTTKQSQFLFGTSPLFLEFSMPRDILNCLKECDGTAK